MSRCSFGIVFLFYSFFFVIDGDVIDKVRVKKETLKKTFELNGSMVIFCSIISLCLSCCRAGNHKLMADKSDWKNADREDWFTLALMIGSLSDNW